MNLSDILLELKPTPSSYLKGEREINSAGFEELVRVNVALLSTFTSDPLKPYLAVEGAARGMLIQPYFSPFNQLEQMVLDDASALYDRDFDVVVIAGRIEEFAPALVDGFVAQSAARIEEELVDIGERLRSLVVGLRRRTTANILVFNFAAPTFLAAGLADPLLEQSQAAVIQQANQRVAAICREFSGAYVFDYARIVYENGLRNWYSPKLWHMGRIPFGGPAQLETGRHLARYLGALCFPACKCLVLDCDNTLWGGILGEEGLGGIDLGDEYPGNVYKDFQRKLLSVKDCGVLLAVASKNNEEDVLEVFEKHPDSLLKPDDFAAMQIHWNDKATSLANIASALEIGTDSLAFFDDSPVERDWVRTRMPEVTVIEVPETPLGYIHALDESAALDHLAISGEDRARPRMYQEQIQRKRFQGQSVSTEEFLVRLEMTATIGSVDKVTLPRVTQLLAKTNQFNLTTRRHTEAELQAMIDAGAIAVWLRLSDRFGDNGLVGAAIATPGQAEIWTIDTFLMSCRVMGRHVETALLSVLSHRISELGGRAILGEYIPTPKNNMVSEFYPSHCFQAEDCGAELWRWDLSKGEISWPESIQLKVGDGTGG